MNGSTSPPQSVVAALEIALATDPGRDPNKKVNEDTAFARHTPHGHLAVVCDGMGGHVGGREASHLAVETIFRVFDETPLGTPPQHVLGQAIREANRLVHMRGQSQPELKGMGSTAVAVLTHAAGSEVAHVGDSRVYLLTQGQIYQVTKDHSLVQRLVDANMLTPEQASNHPNANQITNALGMRPDVEVELRPQPFPIVAGDTFILCSDGLSDECGPQDFLQILAPLPPLAQAAQQMVDLANARGGHDNITVVMVRVPGGAPFSYRGKVVTPVGTEVAVPAAAATVPTTVEMETLSPQTVHAVQAAGANAPTTTQAPVAPPAFVPPPAGPVAPASNAPAAAAPPFAPPPAFRPSPEAHAAAHDEPRRRSSWWVFIALFVLLVAGAGAAYWWIEGKPSSTEKPASSSSSTSEPEPEPSSTKPTKVAPKPLTPPADEPAPSASSGGGEAPHPSYKPTPGKTGKPTGAPAKPSDHGGAPSAKPLEPTPKTESTVKAL